MMGKKKQIEWEKKNKSKQVLVYFFFSCQGFDNTHYKKERTFLKVKRIINNKYMIPFLSWQIRAATLIQRVRSLYGWLCSSNISDSLKI